MWYLNPLQGPKFCSPHNIYNKSFSYYHQNIKNKNNSNIYVLILLTIKHLNSKACHRISYLTLITVLISCTKTTTICKRHTLTLFHHTKLIHYCLIGAHRHIFSLELIHNYFLFNQLSEFVHH